VVDLLMDSVIGGLSLHMRVTIRLYTNHVKRSVCRILDAETINNLSDQSLAIVDQAPTSRVHAWGLVWLPNVARAV